MLRASLIVLALASCLPTVLSHPANGPRNTLFGCGTEPSEDFLATVQEIAASETSRSLAASEAKVEMSTYSNVSKSVNTLRIQTYFHVVAKTKTIAGGYVPAASLAKQLKVMNADYAPHGIEFVLAGQDWTVNTVWANRNNELAMKKALRKGNYQALNIYFLYNLNGNLGFCYFPARVTTGSDTFYLDGCEVLYSTTPGGSLTNYNQGKTVTHEVGHWFGLMHTFQGGCTGTGDAIADTPASASASAGCPTGRDSCPNDPGQDPIHNYMDYSFDSCYQGFTPNQHTRMLNMFAKYRT